MTVLGGTCIKREVQARGTATEKALCLLPLLSPPTEPQKVEAPGEGMRMTYPNKEEFRLPSECEHSPYDQRVAHARQLLNCVFKTFTFQTLAYNAHWEIITEVEVGRKALHGFDKRSSPGLPSRTFVQS